MLRVPEFEIGDEIEVMPHYDYSYNLIARGVHKVAAVREDEQSRSYAIRFGEDLQWMDEFYCHKPTEKPCMCGAKSVGSDFHSSWC